MRRRHDRRRPAPDGHDAGFTLIELLVALTLISLLSVLLLGGLRFGARVWETGQARGEHFAELEAVQALLRRQLTQARLLPRSDATDEDRASFVGTPESVRFIAPFPAYIGVGGLYRFELAAGESEQGKSLQLAWQLYRPDRSEWFNDEEISRRVLIDGVEAMHLRYFGRLDQDDENAWHESWDSAASLPRLLELRLEFAEDDPRVWPELVVAPLTAP